MVSESGQNQNCNFSDSYGQNRTENQKDPRKIGTAIPILDRFQSDSDALVLEHQIRLISNSETIMREAGKKCGTPAHAFHAVRFWDRDRHPRP